MMHYAIDELKELTSKLKLPIDEGDPLLRYACALVSELAYYHVPQFEIDNSKRTKVVPCSGYTAIIGAKRANDVRQILNEAGFEDTFVVEDRGVVVVGLRVDKILFIGLRGTRFLYDWKINLNAHMTSIPQVSYHKLACRPFFGLFGGFRVHRGFGEESVRVAARVAARMKDQRFAAVEQVVLTGHSLGGAVAAILQYHIGGMSKEVASTIIFGAPRYSDAAGYFALGSSPPTSFRRSRDIVPSVPWRRWGYADHPNEFDTKGNETRRLVRFSGPAHFLWCTLLFLCRACRPHLMEGYRRALGRNAKVKYSDRDFTSGERLAGKHL